MSNNNQCESYLNNNYVNEVSNEKSNDIEFPYDINLIDNNINQELLKHFKGERTGFVQVGPKKWFFPSKYVNDGKHFYNFEVRPDDTWIVTFPRSGTTWTQELVWLIANDVDFETAKRINLVDRFPFLEFSMFVHDEVKKEFLSFNSHSKRNMELIEEIATPGWKTCAELPSPRFIKTHFPFSLLPKNILDTGCKVVYIARNPKDVAVSFYHLNRLMKTQGYYGDFSTYWKFFKNNLQPWTPYWEHVREGWEKRHHPNVLFMFYEEMRKDLKKSINRVANFLGKTLTEDQVQQLVDHLHIDNFSKNPSVNYDVLKELGFQNAYDHGYVRKGAVEGWQAEYTPEVREEAEKWIEENLKLTDLRFPL